MQSPNHSIANKGRCRHHAGKGIDQIAVELTEACNYKCIMCDYWRIKTPTFVTLKSVATFFETFITDNPHSVKSVLLTGGEPLLHPCWRDIVRMIPPGPSRNLCTNGSPIIKKNEDVADLFDRITISIDGATRETFARIRGYDHLDRIIDAAGKLKTRNRNLRILLKMTLQRSNFREIASVFDLCKLDFIDGIGFGIPDFSFLAFGHSSGYLDRQAYMDQLVPTIDEIEEFESLIQHVRSSYASELERGVMYEGDFNRYVARFKQLRGIEAPIQSRNCCVMHHSAVLKANDMVLGCYFLPSITTVQELETLGASSHADWAHKNETAIVKICEHCEQLSFPNSPYHNYEES